MARIEVYLPGDGSFTAEMSDDALTDLALGMAKNFHEENGSWVSMTSGDGTTRNHYRWVPSSAGVAFFWDDNRGGIGQPSLSLVV